MPQRFAQAGNTTLRELLRRIDDRPAILGNMHKGEVVTIRQRLTRLDPDGNDENPHWLKLPVGVTESEAIELARRVIWPLYLRAVVESRMRHTLRFFSSNPALDLELAQVLASPECREAFERLLPFVSPPYSYRDTLEMPADNPVTGTADDAIAAWESPLDWAMSLLRRIQAGNHEVLRFLGNGMLQYLYCRLGGRCHCRKSLEERETIGAEVSIVPALELSLKHWTASMEMARVRVIAQIREQWPAGLLISDEVAAESDASPEAAAFLRDILTQKPDPGVVVLSDLETGCPSRSIG